MAPHEYPHGYNISRLDRRVTLDTLSDFFTDTGETGEQSIAWLDAQHDAIATKLTEQERWQDPTLDEIRDRENQVEARHHDLISQRLVRDFVDERRKITPDEAEMPYRVYKLSRMPTMGRPDIQRLQRGDQKRVLQHEVWTEAERLWLVEQLLSARGYEPTEESEQLHQSLDESLLSLDGMSMTGLAEWSEPLKRLQVQFGVGGGDQAKAVAVVSTHKDSLGLREDVTRMSVDELVKFRDDQIRRIETEIALYHASDGPGSPSDKLYDQIRWLESLIDIKFSVKDSGAAVETMILERYNDSAATLVARSLRALQLPDDYAATLISINLPSYIRGVGIAQDVTRAAHGWQMDYTDLEAYVAELWQVGEQLAEREAVREATRIVGHAAQEAVAHEQEYAIVR